MVPRFTVATLRVCLQYLTSKSSFFDVFVPQRSSIADVLYAAGRDALETNETVIDSGIRTKATETVEHLWSRCMADVD